MTYLFETYGQVQIVNPQITVAGVYDNFDGTCEVDILLTLGAPQSNASKIGVRLSGFTYDTDWSHSDVETWVTNEVTKYEV